jgi:putative hemolysin
MNSGASDVEGGSAAWLEVRLANSQAEIEAAQRLRYRVFYEEMGAQPTPEMAAEKRDFDAFDEFCDHLLVINNRAEHDLGVVGTYRLHRRETPKFKGFYSSSEYDVAKIAAFKGNVLELGRSCVDADWRTKMTMQLLWRGIAGYVFAHKIDLMFGCASLPGIDPGALALPLSYLYHNHLAPAAIRPRALP